MRVHIHLRSIFRPPSWIYFEMPLLVCSIVFLVSILKMLFLGLFLGLLGIFSDLSLLCDWICLTHLDCVICMAIRLEDDNRRLKRLRRRDWSYCFSLFSVFCYSNKLFFVVKSFVA